MDDQDAIDRARELWPQVSAAIAQRLAHPRPDDVREGDSGAKALARIINASVAMCGMRRRMP